ncbi:MAG: hypothetical protein U5J64_01595 [Halobacteriales archaeon]|nr:hypothetical protein [Halobacteriales archaeon]
MSTENQSEPDLDAISDSAEFVSENVFQLLRLNMILIGIYLTVGGYLANLSPTLQQEIGASYYMIGSVLSLLASILVGYLTYSAASKLASINMYDDPQEEYQKYESTDRLVFNLNYSLALTLLSGFLFGLGIVDGISPTGISIMEALWFLFGLLVLAALPVLSVHFGLRLMSRVRGFINQLTPF